MRPYDAKGDKGVLSLRRDNFDGKDCWIITDGFTVSMAAQKPGNPATQNLSLPRAEFNKLVRFYMRDQKPLKKAK